LAKAVASAPAGARVLLLGGQYADQVVDRGQAVSEPVVIEAAPGASPVLTRVKSYAPGVVWRGLTVTVNFFIYGAHTTLEGMHFDGGGLFARGDDATIRDSEFENGSSIDGIQVSRANRVLIEGNSIHDYDQLGTTGLHSDCIQVFDATDVTIRGNRIRDCYNAGIIISGGSNWGIDRLTIESNFIQGCIVKDAGCKGGAAVDLRDQLAKNLHLLNNTILDGATRWASGRQGWIANNNVIGWLGNSDAPLNTGNVILDWNRGLGTPVALAAGTGNRTAPPSPSFVGRAAGDLHVADFTTVAVSPVGSPLVAGADIDGDRIDMKVAGADAPAAQVPPATDTSAPTCGIVSPASGSTVSGVVTLRASASDNVKVVSVTFLFAPESSPSSRKQIGSASLGSDGTWSLTTSTTGLAPGRYLLTAVAKDAAGNTTTSAAAVITVK
jgi:hypothetical protein